MKKILIVTAIAGLTGGMVWLYGQSSPTPSIILKQPQPEVLVVNTPTNVTVSASIAGDVLPGGANLLRLGANGSSTVLGQLSPNSSVGVNGYSITHNFSEGATGTITLQLSVAIRGQLRRVTSQPFLLAVSTRAITLPPDPGVAGKATLAGIDSDGDGVRDDVQRFIVFAAPESEKVRAALTQQSIALQMAVTQGSGAQFHDASDCMGATFMRSADDVLGGRRASEAYNSLESLVINTPERAKAYFRADAALGSSFVPSTPFSQQATRCSINPSTLPN